MPASASTLSFSIFCRPPRPYPSCRRWSSWLTKSKSTPRPAGRPETSAIKACPCDSPAVVNCSIKSHRDPLIVESTQAVERGYLIEAGEGGKEARRQSPLETKNCHQRIENRTRGALDGSHRGS